MLCSYSAGASQIFAHKIVKPEHSVFAFGISAEEQFEVKNMQDEKETQEQLRRIEIWTHRAMMCKMRYS
jgi:hypothetical protein